jgi:hypothetical protein
MTLGNVHDILVSRYRSGGWDAGAYQPEARTSGAKARDFGGLSDARLKACSTRSFVAIARFARWTAEAAVPTWSNLTIVLRICSPFTQLTGYRFR